MQLPDTNRSYVILLHHCDKDHYDIMIEEEKFLKTWSIQKTDYAQFLEQRPIKALPIKDHRKKYLDYEGPISGGRGYVKRVEKGLYKTVSAQSTIVIYKLDGEILKGTLKIITRGNVHEMEYNKF